MAQIAIKYAIFCDDVRREDNGKFIFIGVYTGALITPPFPARMNLGFFVHGTQSGAGGVPFGFRVIYMPGELEIVGISATSIVENPDGGVFDFSLGFGLEAQRNGYLLLQMSQSQGPWKELERLPVLQSKPSISNAP